MFIEQTLSLFLIRFYSFLNTAFPAQTETDGTSRGFAPSLSKIQQLEAQMLKCRLAFV